MAHQILSEFNDSLDSERFLFNADVRVNAVLCDALFKAGILTRLESERIKNGLQAILKRADYDKNYFRESASKNIHSFVIARLAQLIGEAGKKLYVGRDETEHALTVLRLWLRREIEEISKYAKEFMSVLLQSAQSQRQSVLPVGVLQEKKQCVLWAHWCLAFFEKTARDRERLEEVWRRVNVSAFGAETSFEIDREEIAAALGFEGVTVNSLDAESDADFVVEFINACGLLMTHLCDFAENLLVYKSKEFGFVELKKEVSLSEEKIFSSLLLFRSKAARIFGHQAVLWSESKNFSTMQYRDLRQEKHAVLDTAEIVKSSLQAAAFALMNLRLNERKALETAARNFSGVSELIDYLLKKDVPPDSALETVNKIKTFAAAKNKEIRELNIADLQNISEKIGADIFHHLTLEQSLANKNQTGGTAPERVSEALEVAKESLERE